MGLAQNKLNKMEFDSYLIPEFINTSESNQVNDRLDQKTAEPNSIFQGSMVLLRLTSYGYQNS